MSLGVTNPGAGKKALATVKTHRHTGILGPNLTERKGKGGPNDRQPESKASVGTKNAIEIVHADTALRKDKKGCDGLENEKRNVEQSISYL